MTSGMACSMQGSPAEHGVMKVHSVLEDALLQSHYCCFLRRDQQDPQLVHEIDILFRIRHARKLLGAAASAEETATSLRQKAAFEHSEVLQKYNEAIGGRLERAPVSGAHRLRNRLSQHISWQLARRHHDQITAAYVQLSVREALYDPDTDLSHILTQPEDRGMLERLREWTSSAAAEEEAVEQLAQTQEALQYIQQHVLVPLGETADTTQAIGCHYDELFAHLELCVTEEVQTWLEPFKASGEYALWKAKEVTREDPGQLEYVSECLDLLHSQGVTTLVFDFDRTLVPRHIGAIAVSELHTVALTPAARVVLCCALAQQLTVGVASFSDMADCAVSSEELSGERLIRAVLDREFGMPLSALIVIVAGHPERMTERGELCSCGHEHVIPYSKHHHIHKLCPLLQSNQIRASSIMFFDDNQGNVVRAQQEGMIGVDVDPATGITWDTWSFAIEMAKMNAEMASECGPSDWSFELVRQ